MAIKIPIFIQKNFQRVRIIGTNALDFLRYYLLPPPQYPVHPDPTKKTVLILGVSLQARVPRMVKWLKKQGDYRFLLLVEKGKDFSQFNTEFFHYGTTFRSTWDLRRKLRGFQDLYLIHAISTPSKHTAIAIKQGNFPVIMDVQDMYVSYYGLTPPMLYMKLELPNEKFALQNANGLLAQSLEPWYASKTYGVNRPPALFFPLYCDDENMVVPPQKDLSGEIHIVYVGVIAGSFMGKDHDGQKMLWIARTFQKQKLHFHIYPSPNLRFKDRIHAEYRQEAETNPYFHFHDPVPQTQLAREISRYHFGFIPIFDANNARNDQKRRRAPSLKMFNYLEAGIPIIVSQDLEYQSFLIKRYGAGFEVSYDGVNHVGEKIRKMDYEATCHNILASRDKLSLKNQIHRLSAFYEDVHDDFQANQKA